MRLSTIINCGLVAIMLGACAHTPPPPPPGPSKEELTILELEKKTRQLMETSDALFSLQGKHEEQVRRLKVICADYPEHQVCDLHKARHYALEAFCSDKEFVGHVDEIVNACHQGACKQVDQAELLTRSQYMTLVTKLPHKLITFGGGKTKLDRRDKKELQQFIEALGSDGGGGYMIIVGRASKDGPWRLNLRLALDRAENTRRYLVETLGIDSGRVGYITYGHSKMYLTELDAQRLSTKKLSAKQANRSSLVFTYPCHNYQPRQRPSVQ